MRTLRIPVATMISVVALFCASTSFADDEDETETASATTPVAAPPPARPVAAPPQVGTTQTTAAPYAVVSGDRTTERTVERRPNRTLLSTGAGIFVLSYGSSVVAGAVSDRDEDKRLFIPVVGPWMDLANRDCGPANPCGANEDVAKAMLVTSGVVQGAGLLLALSSLIIPESESVSERTSAKAKVVKPEVKVAPVSFAAGAGLGAVGRF